MPREDTYWVDPWEAKKAKAERKEERRIIREEREQEKIEAMKPVGCMTRMKRKIAGKCATIAKFAGNKKLNKKLSKIADPAKAIEDHERHQAELKAQKHARKKEKEDAKLNAEDAKDNKEMLEEAKKAASDKGYLTHMEVGHEGNLLIAKHKSRELKDESARWKPSVTRGDLPDFSDLLREAEIALIRIEYFRQLAADDEPPPRRQDLPPNAFKVITHWSQIVDKRIVSVSHTWLTKHHPDPHGDQIKQIVSELDRYWTRDEDLIFYDWCSLYQDEPTPEMVPGATAVQKRTEAEQRCFERAMKGMELLFSQQLVNVLVIPKTPGDEQYIKGSKDKHTEYWNRGWCYMELVVANYFQKVLNAENPAVHDMVWYIPGDPMKICEDIKGKSFRNFADKGRVGQMLERVFEAGREGNLRCAAENADFQEVQDLLALGAKVDATDAYGRTALHRVAMVPTGPKDMLEFADPILGKRAGIAKLLVGFNADLNKQANCGYTPLEFARICGQVEVSAVLSSKAIVPHAATSLKPRRLSMLELNE